jgi:endoglucanase
MSHFVKDDGFNTFRLPVGWQWLINSNTNASSVLDTGNWGLYNQFVIL